MITGPETSSRRDAFGKFVLSALVIFPLSFYAIQVVVTLIGLTSINNIRSAAPTHFMVGALCGILSGGFLVRSKAMLSSVLIASAISVVCVEMIAAVIFISSAQNGSVRSGELPGIFFKFFLEFAASGALAGYATWCLLLLFDNWRRDA